MMSSFASFSIDTRSILPGQCFVALDGVNQKGYQFIEEALSKKASGVICSKDYQSLVSLDLHSQIDFVDSPITEMSLRAREHRMKFDLPVIGVCGSVGKTSTKQFLAYLLNKKMKVLSTKGNLNNHLGLPMMVSSLSSEHEVAVLEMGANHLGDLKSLVQIAQPTLAVLTPIAPEHLAGFGSLEGVYEGELEILSSKKLQTLVTVDDDLKLDARLSHWKGKVVRVGFTEKADFRIEDLKCCDGFTEFKIQEHLFKIPTSASFLAINAALAIAAASEIGSSPKDFKGVWDLELPSGRFTLRFLKNGVEIIDDTYNSSPKAFSAAIQSLHQFKHKRKWVVFSDMLELGDESTYWHQKLGEELASAHLDFAWAFGHDSKQSIARLSQISESVNGRWFENSEMLTKQLIEDIRPGDLILFKGSRSTRVDLVLKELESR